MALSRVRDAAATTAAADADDDDRERYRGVWLATAVAAAAAATATIATAKRRTVSALRVDSKVRHALSLGGPALLFRRHQRGETSEAKPPSYYVVLHRTPSYSTTHASAACELSAMRKLDRPRACDNTAPLPQVMHTFADAAVSAAGGRICKCGAGPPLNRRRLRAIRMSRSRARAGGEGRKVQNNPRVPTAQLARIQPSRQWKEEGATRAASVPNKRGDAGGGPPAPPPAPAPRVKQVPVGKMGTPKMHQLQCFHLKEECKYVPVRDA